MKTFSSIFQSAGVISPRILCKKLFYRVGVPQKWKGRHWKTQRWKKKRKSYRSSFLSLSTKETCDRCLRINHQQVLTGKTLSLLPPDVAMTCLMQGLRHDTLAKNHLFLIWVVTCGHARSSWHVSFPFGHGRPIMWPMFRCLQRPSTFSSLILKRFFTYAKCGINWPRKKRTKFKVEIITGRLSI